jgi:hypothetical protein
VEGIVKLRSVGLARRVSLARHARFAPLRRTILPEIFLFDFENGKDATTVLSSCTSIGQRTFSVAAKDQPPARSRAGPEVLLGETSPDCSRHTRLCLSIDFHLPGRSRCRTCEVILHLDGWRVQDLVEPNEGLRHVSLLFHLRPQL